MSSLPASGAVPPPAGSALRGRLALFGVSGLIGLAIIAFWTAGRNVRPGAAVAHWRDGRRDVFAPISAAHWLGTDYLGRDMLARVIEGARYTVGVAFVATLLASGTGTVLALLAAASGRWIDAVLSRGLDTLTAIPSKMFALLMVAGFGSSIPMLVVDRGDHLRAGRIPHRALAGGQHQRARLRHGGARPRRRHRLRHAARDPAQHHRADAGRPRAALRLRRAAAGQS